MMENPVLPVREGVIPAGNGGLYTREVGQGPPVILLHGGPDFDRNYMLPEMDRLADLFRLIYYDQRGRGRSARGVQPEEVSLESEIEDIERVREHFGLEQAAVLGHSWGGLLALEYALRHPERVARLVLLNTGPASREDYLRFRQSRGERWPEDIERLKAIAATPRYQTGDLEADAGYYRIHFRATLPDPARLESLVRRLRVSFTQESICKARAIEDRLMAETWGASDYDLFPGLARLRLPALVLHGEHDFIPTACAEHIARAIPGARFVLLKGIGHFSFLEAPGSVREAVAGFLRGSEP